MPHPFDALELTDEEEQDCYDRAFRLLSRTLRSYDERDEGRPETPLHHAQLDSARWKLLKTQANASLYVEQDSSTQRDDAVLGADWENPVAILAAGTIPGELDEVMLGLKALDANSIRSRTEMLTNHIADSAVLAELLGPTEVDPFRFLGVTWLLYEQSWPLKSVVRPRDLLTLTSTGTMTRENGDRIGYEVVQPATFSQCPPLPGTAERGKVMYVAIFKQQEPGVVDVYVTTYVETQGAILDKVVVGITWKAMLRFWDAPQLAEMKKLQSCIATRGLERRQEQGRPSSSSSSTSTSTSSSASACKRCFERPSMMRRFSTIGHGDKSSCCCALCASSVCSSCRAERILKVTDKSSGKLKDRRVIVCQSCLVLVQQLRPTEIAMLNRKHRSGQPSR